MIVPAILLLTPVAEAWAGPECSKCGSEQANETTADDWCDTIEAKKALREAFATYRRNPSSPGIDQAATSEEAAEIMKDEVLRDARAALGHRYQGNATGAQGGATGSGAASGGKITMEVDDKTCQIENQGKYKASVCAEWFEAALGHEQYHQGLCWKQAEAGTRERLRCEAELKDCETQYKNDQPTMDRFGAADKRDRCLRQAYVRCDAREEEEGYAGEILDLNDRFLEFAKKCGVNAKCSLTNAETLELKRIRDRSQKASRLLRQGGQ